MSFAACSDPSPQFEEECASPRDLVGPQCCSICDKVFSKRKLRLRYECGICERSVCSACAPNSVQLEGFTGLQRVCTPCIANAAQVSAAQSRLVRLGEQLDALGGKSKGPSSVAAKCTNLEEALAFSESAIAPLEDLRDRLAAEKAHSEKLDAALETQSYRLQAEKARLAVEQAHSEKLEKALEETEKRVRAQLEQELIEAGSCSTRVPWSDSSMMSKSSPRPEKQPDNQPARMSSISSKPRAMNCVNSCKVM